MKDIDYTERVQRLFTKRMAGLAKLSYEEKLDHLNLPGLSYRRIRGNFIEAKEIST